MRVRSCRLARSVTSARSSGSTGSMRPEAYPGLPPRASRARAALAASIVRTAAEHYGSVVRVLAVVPAYRAARTVAGVVEGLRAGLGADGAVIVVDDGSDDATAAEAERAG